jgi:hypothetical protein
VSDLPEYRSNFPTSALYVHDWIHDWILTSMMASCTDTRPFEGDDEIKWQYFLGDQRFLSFLRDLGTASDAQRHIWGAEYNRVIQDLEVLQSQGHVRNFDDIS